MDGRQEAEARHRTRIVPLVVASVFFLDNFDSVAVVSVLPPIAESFGVPVTSASAGVTAYLVALAICIPLSGWAADRFGARQVFRGAILAFLLGALGAALAPGLGSFVVARVLQGCGAAMMVPVGRMVVLRTAGKADFVRAMAFVTTPALVGATLAPAAGGFFATYASWRAVFLLEVPAGLVALVLISIHIRDGAPVAPRRLDLPGFALTAGGLAGLMVVMGFLADRRPFDAAFAAVLGATLPLLALALRHNLHSDSPLLDFRLLRYRSFCASLGAGSLFLFAAAAVPFLLPVLFQLALGMSALQSGLLTSVWAAAALAMKMAAPPILRRWGYRSVLLANSLLLALAVLGCAQYAAAPGAGPLAALLLGLVLTGFGIARSLQIAVLNSFTYAEVAPEDVGRATGFSGMVRQFSNSFGVALAAVLLSLFTGPAATPDAADLTGTFLIIAALPLIAAAFFYALPAALGGEMSGHRAVGGT